jgi:hypothetical protein
MKTIEKKEPYLHTLNTRGNIYEEFLPDQVLTHKNLNKVVNYFEDQDRLSRVYLIGVGVGCGLNIVSFSEGSIITNGHIEIGQGVGVTTDGDIIKTETRRFHYYSVLTDRASYELFDGLQVYEIYEQEEAGRPTDELPLSSFTINEPGSLKDYIVVAYVEDYTEDEGLCGGSGCDETGNKVYSNIKFLLIHKSNKSALVSEDTIYNSHNVLAYYDTLPELCMPRVLLTKENTLSGIDIQDQFTNSYALKNDLYTGITTIINRFKHRINFAKYGVNIPQITTYFDDIFVVQDESHVQYKYDLMKDLIDTYREIRELILFTRFECVANINAFPKHVLLGTLDEASRLQTRHDFYPSPTVAAENEDNLMAIRTLCIKFFNQLKEYKIPNVPTAAIKVTPSKSYEFKLSERSIPYYYETKNSLISNWSPWSVQLRKAKNQLGYHVQNLKNIDCIQKPLEYSHLDKDFYRIEGHIGKDFRLALRKINNLKAKYNLAFDVKTVSIGFPVNKVSLDDDKCDTKDYAILLETWEQEFLCVSESATEFFSKYQYDDLGNNDTSTTIYSLASQEQQQVLQLFGKKKATEDTKNPEKISGKTINTNMEALESGQQIEAARYNQSLQYAIDEAYSYVGTQNVPGLYLATVALGIIDQAQGTVDRGSDYFFYTEAPIKIIAGLADIKNNFLESLDEVYVTEKWTALNNAIEGLCAHIDQVLFAISEVGEDSTFGTRTHDKMYEYFIYELSKLCCLKGKFAWLKEQLDEIRDNLYREVILSRLIEKHPGAEHMAGVPKGGTFLMVYLGGTEELLEDDSVLSGFNGTVQFDFALPYICCSDCPPETIVYNVEPDVTLTIAKTKYCLPTDEGQQDFITSITDGIITSPQGDTFIVQTDTGYAFDPTGVPNELLGQPLTFLVNGTTPVVPLEICVYKLPSDITPTVTFLSWNEAGINLDLSVSHELEALSYYSYVWNRADGSEIGTTKDLAAVFFANAGETFSETITVTISVTDSQVPCTITTDVVIDFSRPIENNVEVPPIICHRLMETSPEWTAITVTPSDATLTSPQVPGDGANFIEQDVDGNYFINPGNVPNELAGEEITFIVNGETIDGVSTRVAKLPLSINNDGSPVYSIVEWDETGAIIHVRAAHIFQDEEYIQYSWIDLNNDNTQIGTDRILMNHRVEDFGEGIVSVNYRVIMSVAGLEDSCTQSFDVSFTLERPTLNIPRGICFGQTIGLDVNPDDTITTSIGEEMIIGGTSTIDFDSNLVADEHIGQQIEIFVNGSPAATTTVYKIPGNTDVDAGYEFVRWEGDNLVVNLMVAYTVPGVSNPENYLETKWFDESGNPISTTTEHVIPSGGDNVDRTYTVVVCVQASLMDATPCETTPITVTINEDAPAPDVPTDLGIQDRYCWKEGDAALNVPIAISPTDFVITSPQVGTSILRQNTSSHTFRASAIANALAGELIQFQIDGTTVDSTRVYKLPLETSIAHDVNGSQWGSGSYSFKLSHSFDDKTYFDYEVIDIETGERIEQSEPSVFKVQADNSINRRYRVRVFVPNLCTTDEVTITVADVLDPGGPTDNPTTLERLNCNTAYNTRLSDLGFGTTYTGLKNTFKATPFNDAITNDILSPMEGIITQITRSTDLINDSIGALSQLNVMRDGLSRKYLGNPNITAAKQDLLTLDELMEIMSLELLRCVNENDAELGGIYNEMITISTSRASEYGGTSRTTISQSYLDSFTTKGDTFKNDLTNTFTK